MALITRPWMPKSWLHEMRSLLGSQGRVQLGIWPFGVQHGGRPSAVLSNGMRPRRRLLHGKPNLSTRPTPDPADPETMGEYYDPGLYGSRTRTHEFYHDIVAPDLLALTYNHAPVQSTVETRRFWDGSSPYHKNRPSRLPKGRRPPIPALRNRTPDNIPSVKSIVVHAMVREAIQNKPALLSAALQFQCITSQRPQFVQAKKGVAAWKLREGQPVSIKSVLKGEPMYNFLSTLAEIVMPQMKDFNGIKCPRTNCLGVVTFFLPESAVPYFPEIQASYDMFPKLTGFDVYILTTAIRSREAQLLVSAFGLPFEKPT